MIMSGTAVSAVTRRLRGHDHHPPLHRRSHQGAPRSQPPLGDGHQLRGAPPSGAPHGAHPWAKRARRVLPGTDLSALVAYLSRLKAAELVEPHRSGKKVYYRL